MTDDDDSEAKKADIKEARDRLQKNQGFGKEGQVFRLMTPIPPRERIFVEVEEEVDGVGERPEPPSPTPPANGG